MDSALGSLIRDVVQLQGNGDYAGTKAFMGKWAVIDPDAKTVIDTMGKLPVDIRPAYPTRI